MVECTRINGTKIMINPFQIEFIEETGDTVVLFSSGRKMVVKEKPADIFNRFAGFLSVSIKNGIVKSKGA